MKALRKYEPPKSAEDVEFCKLELLTTTKSKTGESRKSDFEAKVYRAAIGDDDLIYMLDIIAESGKVRAMQSALTCAVSATWKFRDCPSIGTWRSPERDDRWGYRTYSEAIGGRVGGSQLMHFICISNKPGFMPFVTPSAVAKCLGGDAFSTPFLTPLLHGEGVPDWMPWLTQKLVDSRTLKYLDCYNCNAGLLIPRENELENIISEGVKTKALPWVPYDPAEIIEAGTELLLQEAASGDES